MWWCGKLLRVMVVVTACVCSAAQGQQQQQQNSGILLSALHNSNNPNTGVPITSTSAQRPSTHETRAPQPLLGVPLPSVPHFGANPVVVPLEQDPRNVGVPLPPYTVGGGAHDVGVLSGGLQGVKDPQQDQDVQRLLRLPALTQHLQVTSRADTAVKITDIITAHKQVVSGQLVYLTLKVGETVCPRGTLNTALCDLDPREDTHVCEVVAWERPWLNSTKIIHEKSRCADTEDDTDFKNYGTVLALPVASPSDVALTVLPVGVEEHQVVAEAFSFVDRGSDSDFRGRLVDYELSNIKFDPVTNTSRVQVDVEYGFTLCLKSPDQAADPRPCSHDLSRQHYVCSVFVVHSPNHLAALEVVPILDDIDDIHCEKKRTGVVGVEELVVAVEAPCAGCPQPVPLTDPTLLEVADFALTEYDRNNDDDELHTIIRLIRAHSQVVAGVKYFLTVELADTDCKKIVTGVDVNRTFCRPDPMDSTEICQLHVVDQPWVPARDLVMARCQDKDSYDSSGQDEFIVAVSHGGMGLGAAPGAGPPPQGGAMDGATMDVVRAVVAEHNRREDDSEYEKLVKVHEASSQVVSGVMVYRVAVEVGETRCHKRNPTTGTGDHCDLDPSEEHEVCEAEVQTSGHQTPNLYRFLTLHCDDLHDYLRKMMMPTVSSFSEVHQPFLDDGADATAGYQTVATNDSRVAAVASFVVAQYNLHGDDDELYALTQVTSALSQVAGEGTKYHLELEMAETHCKKYLPVSDPSRCPLDYSEEREMCQAEALMPHTANATMQLTKLYCDDISDYFTRKFRVKLGQPTTINEHLSHGPGSGGSWITINTNDTSLQRLGHLMADEYDSRSDDENIFIFHKVLQARKQVAGGLKYHLVVELQETVCPKYKRRINKSRCVPDIGEDHMVCEANILIQPWLQRQDVSDLRCAEKDDFLEGDDSVEVLYPHVHPSAHTRPKFQSQFLVRTSDESDESNERFYHPSGRRNSRYDTDEDDDDDSDEIRRVRGKRTLLGGQTPVEAHNEEVDQLAKLALATLEEQDDDIRVRVVDKVISATKQIVAGELWTVKMLVVWTKCQKGEVVEDLSTCERDTSEPIRQCTAKILRKLWLKYTKTTSIICSPLVT